MNRYIVMIEDGYEGWEMEVSAVDEHTAWVSTQALLPHSISSPEAVVVGVRPA